MQTVQQSQTKLSTRGGVLLPAAGEYDLTSVNKKGNQENVYKYRS